MKIYVASSWKNPVYPTLIESLRAAGHDVFDFRAQNGFNWGEVDPDFKQWTAQDYIKALSHPLPVNANDVDMEALRECDVCIALHECGKASHFELGYAVGQGKLGIVFLQGNWTVDVIYRNCTLVTSTEGLLSILGHFENARSLDSEGAAKVDRWADALRKAHWFEDDDLRSWRDFMFDSTPPNGDGSEVELWRSVARIAIAKLQEG